MDLSEKRLNSDELFDRLSDPSYINGEATEKISKLLKSNGNIDDIVSVTDYNFNNVISAFDALCNSQDIKHTNIYKHKDVIATKMPHICLAIRPDYGGYEKY